MLVLDLAQNPRRHPLGPANPAALPARSTSRVGAATPHDLRRTASTLAGEIGCPDGWVAKCLDHANVKDEDGKPLPRVTRNHSFRKTSTLISSSLVSSA
jgi:integrase